MRSIWRLGAIVISVLAVGFAVYLVYLYQQLESSFAKQEEFVPTRLYSDVSRIAPPAPKTQVLARLKALGYKFQETENRIQFNLNPVQYPPYLIPENHPILDPGTTPGSSLVSLEFDSPEQNAVLQAITLGEREVPDLYLEPEIVATLASGAASIRDPIQFEEIPASVWQAIIAIEDQHFLEHKGFDPKGLARAIWVNLKTLSFAQGGSTITQQLVKNLSARRGKNIFRKINELFLALILEVRFSKEQILERYLNEVYLGQVGNLEVHGVAEGAKHFFGKNVTELNLGEVALMAGLIRGPHYYSPYRHFDRAREREMLVLRKMAETGYIAPEEAETAEKLPIRLAPPVSSANKAPYFTDFVKAELIRHLRDRMSEEEIIRAGFRVYTTLDMTMNSAAQRAVAQGISQLEKRLKLTEKERLEGALAAVDHNNGYIRALIGGKNYAETTFNRILNMRRQVGSTFKPVVYLAAFQKGLDPQGVPYGPGHPIEDSPWTLTYDQKRQSWTPRNYDKEFKGWVSFRTALAHSINTAAAKLGVEVGLDQVIATSRALGIEQDLPKVPSLSLGVAELSPVELLRVYATIANHGVQDELTVIRGITHDNGSQYARFIYHPKEVVPPGPVDLLTDMLQDVFISGTARDAVKMGFERPAAGKTGTTSHHRDAWFAGFTPQLTTVVWVGADLDIGIPAAEKEKKKEKARIVLTGAGSALPIWVQFMKEALEAEPPTPFPVSNHLTSVRIDQMTGRLATSDCPNPQTAQEKFIIGQEPKDSSCERAWPSSSRETEIGTLN